MAQNVSPLWYWLVLLVYCGFVVYLGLKAYRQQKQAGSAEEENQDFWITGRSQPAYMVGMAVASGWMLIGMITWMTWATYDQGYQVYGWLLSPGLYLIYSSLA